MRSPIRKRRPRLLLLSAFVASAGVLAPIAGPVRAALGASCPWMQVPTPTVDAGDATLTAVHAIATDDVWAVGYVGFTGGSEVAEHWDGSTWTVVPTAGGNDGLSDIDGVATDDVWAVGGAEIEHWDGSAWTGVAAPSPGPGFAGLVAVDAIAEDDVWAVGSHSGRTLVEHWDGSAWSVVASPSPSTGGDSLSAVSASSPDDVWAVGTTAGGWYDKNLIEHWNGMRWSVVAGPNAGYGLTDAVAVSAHRAWAVGAPHSDTPLIERWNGSKWSRVSPEQLTKDLVAIDASAADDVWAVGTGSEPWHSRPGPPGTGHFNGSEWTEIMARSGGQRMFNTLSGVSIVSPNDVWAVGFWNDGSDWAPNHPLIEHWNGTRWSLVPSPPIGVFETLTGVAAPDGANAWAVGFSHGNLVERWDGSSWGPVWNGGGWELGDVAASDSRHVWIVGWFGASDGETDATASAYWNGSRWVYAGVEDPPGADDGAQLLAVSALSTEAWAVGENEGRNEELIERWNGTAWTAVTGPRVKGAVLQDVLVLGPRNVWAVGLVAGDPLIVRWDGTRWRVVPAPSTPAREWLSAIAGHGDDLWAVGSRGTDPLILHWNGRAWRAQVGADTGSAPASLLAVAVGGGGGAWAVGRRGDAPLVEHHTASGWKVASFGAPRSARLFGIGAVPHSPVMWIVGSYADAGSTRALTMRRCLRDVSRPPRDETGRRSFGAVVMLRPTVTR